MAGKFVGKLMNIIGLEEEYEDEEEFYEDEEEEEEERPRASRRRENARATAQERNVESRREAPSRASRRENAEEERRGSLRPVEKPREEQPVLFSDRKNRKKEVGGNTDVKLVVYRPHSYNDSQNIIDNLVANKPIIVNLEDLDPEVAQRVLDFMSGAAYAENGSVMKVSRGIFLIAPNNVDVFGNLEEEMRTNDFFNLNSEEYNG